MSTPLSVLILEDRLSDAELMLHELRQTGFKPEWQRVETEQDYLAHLEPGLDIILADYRLPQFDAARALEILQSRELDIPDSAIFPAATPRRGIRGHRSRTGYRAAHYPASWWAGVGGGECRPRCDVLL